MKVSAIYKGDGECEIVHHGTGKKITTDLAIDNEGKGRTFSPTDIFAASLGACILTIMGKMAERKGINLSGLQIEIEKIMASNPRRISELMLNIKFSESITKEQKDLFLATVKTCPVHNSLNPEIKITVSSN